MILDRYITENKSIDSAVALLDDLALECAVSLEAAHNDLMLECCQVEFQAVTEGHSVEAINEGIFDIIKKFFKAIWNMLKKIFGIKGSGGSSSGGGGSSGGSTNTKEQKKEADEVDKELERQKNQLDELLKQSEEKRKKAEEELKKQMDEAQKRLEKKKKGDSAAAADLQQTRLEVEAQIRAEIEDEVNKIRDTKINDPFVSICPISTSFFNSLVDKMNELCEDMRNVPDMDQGKFESMQKIIEIKFLREICDAIDRTTQDMEDKIYSGNGRRFLMDIDTATVSNIVSRYKELTAPRQDSLRYLITVHHTYNDFKKVIQGIKFSATEELNIDFQAQLDSLAKATMNGIKPDNAYTNANIGSLIARIKMRLITDLSQIIAAIGAENKKARLYQLNGIRSLLHAVKQLDAAVLKKVDADYIYSEMRKRGVEP